MKAYKVFDENWACRDFVYEVGKTYNHDGEFAICNSGFHACEKLVDCFSYYPFDPKNKVAEVELLGEIQKKGNDSKLATNIIKIVKELSWNDVLTMVNIGISNTGHSNTGHRNTGHSNTGHWNTGDRNTGSWNTGDRNTGDFNSKTPLYITVFNKKILKSEWDKADKPLFLYFDLTVFISFDAATDDEKIKYKKEIETCGGFLRALDYKEAFQASYAKASQDEKDLLLKLPNFDADVFYEISGIRV